MEHKEEFQKILEKFNHLAYIKPVSLPNIDLYMDQVTTFMDEKLESFKRYPDDKILTKTMINNYTKNDLLPPSDKKKYSQEHLLMLIFIYYLKNILSISDIQTLLAPLSERYFENQDGKSLKDIYKDITLIEAATFKPFYKDVLRKIHIAENSFTDMPEDEQDYLQNFAMVCMLAFDVYLKKQMIETIIDDMKAEAEKDEPKKDKKEKKR